MPIGLKGFDIENEQERNESNHRNCSSTDQDCMIEWIKNDLMDYPPPPHTKPKLLGIKNVNSKKLNGQFDQARHVEGMFKVNIES